jgi:hypothetical protein
MNTNVQTKQRATNLTQPTVATTPASIFGCEALFDICTDAALMSLSFEGTAPFLDWIGWERTDVCVIKKAFINFVRAEASGESKSAGWLADPCADPNSFEVDYCDFTLTDFARLRRESPTRDITKVGLRYCEIQPRYRLDGSPITNQREYDFRLAVEVLLQDLKPMIVEGNKGTPGQFSGLELLVKTGYADSDGSLCPAMDSIVVDFNHNDLDGGDGITWNGAAVANTYGYIDLLHAAYRRIRHRIRMAPALAAQRMAVGDMVLVMPEDFSPCVLDAFNCWSFCGGDYTLLDTREARANRLELNSGAFGAGHIVLDGFDIPIMPYDWGLINSGSTFDSYLLTGAVGNVKLIQGQFNDLTIAASERPDKFSSTDGGRLLNWAEDRHTCEIQVVEMQPRLLMWAPWAQARFMDTVCEVVGGALSADPWNTYFPY